MTFAKPTKYETIDDRNPSLCSVHGCTNWWSVKVDKPKCSFHQWNSDVKPRAKPLPELKEKTVAQWYDDKEKDIF